MDAGRLYDEWPYNDRIDKFIQPYHAMVLFVFIRAREFFK